MIFFGYMLLNAEGASERSASIRAVLDAQADAWNRGDLDAFMTGYWNSEELTFYSGGDVTKGWHATLARYRKRYQTDGKEMGTLRFSDVEVTLIRVISAVP